MRTIQWTPDTVETYRKAIATFDQAKPSTRYPGHREGPDGRWLTPPAEDWRAIVALYDSLAMLRLGRVSKITAHLEP